VLVSIKPVAIPLRARDGHQRLESHIKREVCEQPRIPILPGALSSDSNTARRGEPVSPMVSQIAQGRSEVLCNSFIPLILDCSSPITDILQPPTLGTEFAQCHHGCLGLNYEPDDRSRTTSSHRIGEARRDSLPLQMSRSEHSDVLHSAFRATRSHRPRISADNGILFGSFCFRTIAGSTRRHLQKKTDVAIQFPTAVCLWKAGSASVPLQPRPLCTSASQGTLSFCTFMTPRSDTASVLSWFLFAVGIVSILRCPHRISKIPMSE